MEMNKLSSLLKRIEVDDGRRDSIAIAIEYFPFSELENLTVEDHANEISVIVKLLLFMCKSDRFYAFSNSNNARQTVNFVCRIMSACKAPNMQEVTLLGLIEALNLIVIRSNTNLTLRERLLDGDRLLISIKDFVTSNLVSRTGMVSVFPVLQNLFQKTLNVSCVPVFVKILDTFQKWKLFGEVATILSIIFDTYDFSSELFRESLKWFYENGADMYNQLENNADVLSFIKLFNTAIDKSKVEKFLYFTIKTSHQEFMKQIVTNTADWIILYNKNSLNEDLLKLLANIVLNYKDNDKIMIPENYNVVHEIAELPDNFELWPRCRNKIFYYFCHILCDLKQLLWSGKLILETIAEHLCSVEKLNITRDVLKSMCFIFPLVMVDYLDNKIMDLGKQILELIPVLSYEEFTKLLTLHVGQFVWMLYNGSDFVSVSVLKYWLLKSSDVDLIAKVVLRTKAESILVHIAANEKDKIVVDKALELVQKLQNDEISKQIVNNFFLGDEEMLHRLMLCKPLLPTDNTVCMELIDKFSATIHHITDTNGLCEITKYLAQILNKTETPADALQVIDQYWNNFVPVATRLKTAPDLLSEGIMKLFVTINKLQKSTDSVLRHHIFLGADELFSEPSDSKINNGINLLLRILPHNFFVKAREACPDVLELHHKLLAYAFKPHVSRKCFVCLVMLMRKHPMLVAMPSTTHFIEAACYFGTKGPEFLNLLTFWLKLTTKMSKEPDFLSPLADKVVIEKFIKRSELTPSLV